MIEIEPLLFDLLFYPLSGLYNMLHCVKINTNYILSSPFYVSIIELPLFLKHTLVLYNVLAELLIQITYIYKQDSSKTFKPKEKKFTTPKFN